MAIIEKTIEKSSSLATALDRFIERVDDWIEYTIRAYRNEPPNSGRGQLNYTTAWEPLLKDRPSAQTVAFLVDQRDTIREHFEAQSEWLHGYWCHETVRRGTEHFRLFLSTLARLAPEDEETRAQMLDAAEHIGNWSDDAPGWYDEYFGLFRSLRLGTRLIDTSSAGWNVPDHLNLAQLSLNAYEISGEEKFRELAMAYAIKWADAVLASDKVPVGVNYSGALYELDGTMTSQYRAATDHVGPLCTDLYRAENILANGGMDLFLRVWRLTGEERLRSAVEKLLDVLLPQLADADAGALADAIRRYRTITGDQRYDEAIQTATDLLAPYSLQSIGMQANVMRLTKPSGIGKRADMPVWFEDLHLRRHNPILLSVAAEINQDAKLATFSLDLARTYFELARETLRLGRLNSDAANTVSAIARGHGRDNGAGMITGVLEPLHEAALRDQLTDWR